MAPLITSDGTIGESISNAGADAAVHKMTSSSPASHSSEIHDHAVDTEVLIVGAGPAGAALACFLGSHGMLCDKRDICSYD